MDMVADMEGPDMLNKRHAFHLPPIYAFQNLGIKAEPPVQVAFLSSQLIFTQHTVLILSNHD